MFTSFNRDDYTREQTVTRFCGEPAFDGAAPFPSPWVYGSHPERWLLEERKLLLDWALTGSGCWRDGMATIMLEELNDMERG